MITVIGNLKGGAGKSTVTFNIGIWLAMTGRSVVAYDLDPQMTLHDVMVVRTEEGYEPSFPVYLPEKQKQLKKKLSSHTGDVLIDVGSANLDGMRVALGLADRVIIPVPPSQADVWSTQRFIRIVEEVRPGDLPEMLGFINRADTHHAVRESDEAAEAIEYLPDIELMEQRLGQRTAFRRAFSEGLAVYELDPRGKAAKEMLALIHGLYEV
ncbi:MAG: ParA family protein [Gammaproteobacteria bacterium]|nr:MAG: ParA family protein [Gammaproteobacteria bacterium]